MLASSQSSWHFRCNLLVPLAGLALITWPTALHAQSIDFYFPSGIGGYDQQLGVTVQSRDRPLYAPPGIMADGFNISPKLDQSVFYNSNPNGMSGQGSWGSRTSASVSASSLWSRNSLALSLGMETDQYFTLPSLDHTNWNIGLGGGYTIGDSQLMLTYSHQNYFQLPTSLGVVQTQTPILAQTDTTQVSYSFDFGRFTVTPDLSASRYQFGTATVANVILDQKYLDRNSLAAGVTTRYSMNDAGGLLVVLRGIDDTYVNPQAGAPSNDSTNFMLLGGIDYQAEGVWRYRVLVGVEETTFRAAQYGSNTSPIAQASTVWTPSGQLTLTGTVARGIQAPQSAGNSGFVLTSANLVVDYEYMRNILLQLRGGAQMAQYLQGGGQSNFTGGAGITWLLNRNLRLSFDLDFVEQTAATNPSTPLNPNTLTIGHYNQSVAAITLHVAL